MIPSQGRERRPSGGLTLQVVRLESVNNYFLLILMNGICSARIIKYEEFILVGGGVFFLNYF